jgi:PAS domain S-box-containing protein
MSDGSARSETGTSGRGGDTSEANAEGGHSRIWLAVLLFGTVAVALYYAPFLGPDGQAVEYVAIDAVAVAVVFASLRLNRPARPLAWALFGAGMLSLTIGDAVWYWLTLVENVSPATSVADLFYLGEYPLLIAGVMLLVRARPDRAVVLDTLMITAAMSVVIIEFVVRPSLNGYTGSPLDLAVVVAYPIGDVALLAVAVRSALTGNLRSPVLALLLVGLTVTFIADVLYLWISQVNPDFDVTRSPIDAAWLMSMMVWAAAAMHPAARTGLVADGADWMRQRTARGVLVAVALLLVPATAAVETASGGSALTPVTLVAWALIVGLVIFRMDAALTVARQSEERFRIIFEDSPAGMVIARRGSLLLVSDTVRKMFGAGGADVRARRLTDFVAAGNRQELIDRIESRAGGARLPAGFETVGLRSDGSQFQLDVRAQDIVLPDGPATIGFILDISARKAAEESLRASERRYRDLFESNPHPMWIYDCETLRFLAVNDTAVEQYGWSADEFRAMTIADVLPLEEAPALLGVLNDGEALLSTARVVRHLRADGSIIDVEVTSHDLTWDGRPARVALAIDVTQRSKLEERLRQAQKMEAVGRLAGGVAHDFNNLLMAISGYAHILRSELEPGDSRVAEVDEIILAGERAATLTRQLLAFSRRQVLQPQDINLNESIQELRSMITRLISEDILLNAVLDPDLGLVRADPGQLTQVLLNLAVNAKDAMPRGGILTLETHNVTLDAAFARAHEGVRAGPHVMLRVTDTGSGMGADTLGHLFEPFFTTKEVGKGTGLGLATVYGIVRQSEGSIDVRSEPGQGSTFEICLPRAPGRQHTPADQLLAEALPKGHETILVVEDEPSVRKLTVSVLEHHGYAVMAASGPAMATEIVKRFSGPIELLLTDVVMPDGNGVYLAGQVASLRPGIRVLLMSGHAHEVIAHHGALADGVILLEKPFSPNLLLSRVRMALDAEAPARPVP